MYLRSKTWNNAPKFQINVPKETVLKSYNPSSQQLLSCTKHTFSVQIAMENSQRIFAPVACFILFFEDKSRFSTI